MLGYTFSEGRYDTGQVLDYLKVIVEMAAARPDLGPEFTAFLADFVDATGSTSVGCGA